MEKNTPSQNQPAPTPNPHYSVASHFKRNVIVVIIFVIIIAAIATYWFANMQSSQTTNTTIHVTVTPTEIPTATPESPATIPTVPPKISCSTDADCQKGYTCEVWGPVKVSGPQNKYCTAPGQVVPL